MLKKYLEIGQIVSTHGIKGEVRVQPWCDSPEFMKKFKTLYFDKNGENSISVKSCRPHGNIVILMLDGIDTVEKAQKLRNKVLFMNRKDAKLPKGDYFIQDLIDCTVVDADDETIKYGILTDVSETGANDVWHITDENGREYLIPAIKQVVIDTDVEMGIIKIRPLKGIFDDED
ncbi:MAG: ribosome maturation factor RimM [Faecalibacterium sp.]|nr:ribosome maturation factor RimM [Ruminococcus sp.]MCM1392701.1 ribosome maturation factor RimM [Ruminococcus sp.]MCM1486372.1 ribosome maturation factor RimM [Faecalibacterium sp.]